MSRSAEDGAGSEHDQSNDETDGPAKNVTDGSDERHGDGIGEEIRRADPETLRCCAFEGGDYGLWTMLDRLTKKRKNGAGTDSQRCYDNTSVESDHEGNDGESYHDEQLVLGRLPLLLVFAIRHDRRLIRHNYGDAFDI